MTQADVVELASLLRSPSSATSVTARFGTVKTVSPVFAACEGVDFECRAISGQTLTVGASCVILTLGIGTTPILIQLV
jgi:hypothetical protein